MNYLFTPVEEGKLVSTRRGFVVSRENHQGIAFVNNSVGPNAYEPPPNPAEPSRRAFKVRFHQKAKKSAAQTEDGRILADGSGPGNPGPRQSRGRTSTMPIQPPAVSQRIHRKTPLNPRDVASSSISSSLGEWAILGCPMNLGPAQRRELKAYLHWLAVRAYPLEVATRHNPVRSNEVLSTVLSDPLVLRCAICIGAVWTSMYMASGTWQTMQSSLQLCSIVNAMLGELATSRTEHILAQAVATLALLAHVDGDYDKWDLHMRGLREILIQWGAGIENYPWVRWIVHRADQNGTSDTVGNLYLPFTRYCTPSPGVLGEQRETEIRRIVERSVGPCCTDESMLDLFADVALTVGSINFTAQQPNVKLEPDYFMETFLGLGVRLMNLPTPFKDLQQPPEQSSGHAYECTYTSPVNEVGRDDPLPDMLRTGLRALESALRLAIMLHANSGTREINNPKAPRVYLPAALNRQLRVVTNVIRKAKANVNHPQNDTSPRDILTKTLRPLIIYLCLVGNRACDLDGDVFQDVVAQERPVYRGLLELVVGSSPADVDMIPESDLDLSRTYNPIWVKMRFTNPRGTIKNVLFPEMIE